MSSFDRTKYYLLASLVLHIKHSKSKDSAVSPRILLSGPAGSEIYQEKLSKALAHHFGAKLLVFHSRLYPSRSIRILICCFTVAVLQEAAMEFGRLKISKNSSCTPSTPLQRLKLLVWFSKLVKRRKYLA
ncbi:hypothetical protein ACSBR1_010523 [Camellia fascicularis]